MSWNYRIVKKKEAVGDGYWFSIREVYYDKKDKIRGWSSDPMDARGETQKDLYEDFNLMSEAFFRPTLELKGGKLLIAKNKRPKNAKKKL